MPPEESLILARVAKGPAAIDPDAVACKIGDLALGYAELEARGSAVAQGLLAMGLVRGARAVILAKNSEAFLEIALGVFKAGLVLLPLNWRLAAPEVAYILRHSEAGVVFCDREFLAIFDDIREIQGPLAEVIVIGGDGEGGEPYASWRDRRTREDPGLDLAPDDIVLQMYTSGTTGLPKGVQLTNRNYGCAFQVMESLPYQRIAAGLTLFAPAPFFHVNGLNAAIRSLRSGGRLLTVDQFRPAEVVALFERERVNRAALAPAMIQMCLDAPGIEERDFSALELITYGGSPISENVLTRAGHVFGCRFAQGYGMTETSGAVAMLGPEDHAEGRHKLLSCGRPLAGLDVRVVGAAGNPCPPRWVGEVVVRGPTVTQGYWRDPEATRGAIRDGWLYTGDAGYFDEEGYLYIHDRIKEMIVSGAENIYPAEVENAIFHHADVADVAVIGVPDEKWGEAVKALVVLKAGASPSAQDILDTARRHVAGYKLPKSMDFIAAIPRNAAGKILRRELRAPYWAERTRSIN